MKCLLAFFWAIVFLLGGCTSAPKQETAPVSVTAYRVEPETIPANFQFVGVAKSSHPVEIRARVEGYLDTINYTEGAMVSTGDLLFTLDPSPFEASLEESDGELARQEAILWRAKRSLERIEPLYELNAASERDRDNALAQMLAAQASVIAAEANVTQAKLNLGYTFITSPITGLTARATSREGTLITPSINGLLTTVSVIDPIWVVFSVSDSELLQGRAEGEAAQLVLPGEENYTVTLTLGDGSQFPYEGHVNFASPTLDRETGSLVVRAEFPNPEGELLPGQFVDATVSGAYRPNAIFVPQESVFQGKDGMYVFVIDEDGTVFSREVEVGVWYESYWIIKKGLHPGELVVAEGTNKVRNGTHVHILSVKSR